MFLNKARHINEGYSLLTVNKLLISYILGSLAGIINLKLEILYNFNMIENIIEQIKTSEEKAKKTVEFSENEASSIIEKAYEDSDTSIKESEAKINEMILLARKKAADDSSAE
ncbi:MAG: hypothetical protein PHR39_05790, partial [Actinomycetota bacterium]|nr:hypothetical protein [Actinomycetota bacterium]